MPAPANPSSSPSSGRSFAILLVALAAVLGFLFRDSFKPGMALFANDGPLGAVTSRVGAFPGAWFRTWSDLNWLGFEGGSMPPSWNYLMFCVLGPLGFINFAPALACALLGVSVWLFCRAAGLHPGVGVLAGLAGALNSDFFSYACWGLPTLTSCVASAFLAFAALLWKPLPPWLRCVLAGGAVGHALMEGFDNGAILSLYVAAFAVAVAWFAPGSPVRRLARGVAMTSGVAMISALVAGHVLINLVSTNVSGDAGRDQDRDSAAERWTFATQWSLPPRETLRSVIPGLYGYRMDTPAAGQYWGTVGSHPVWDSYFASSPRDPTRKPPIGSLRFSGAGHYAGVLVALVGAFALAQSFRRGGGSLLPQERRWVWFWGVVALVSLLFAFGRFAPFYRLIYALPYFNSIRNPVKFLHPLNVALVVLFAYGLQALWRSSMNAIAPRAAGPAEALKAWWRDGVGWEKGWVVATTGLTALALFAWLQYRASHGAMVRYLAEVGFDFDPELANATARFSQGEVGLFVVFLALSTLLLAIVLSGWFAGGRARLAFVALGLVLTVDFVRANAPWVVHYGWRERYGTNPLFDALRAAPHEGRVTGRLPFAVGGAAGEAINTLGWVYAMEWHQHQFRFYDIQCLEVVQLPRPPADFVSWTNALHGKPIREWELTNTRYLLSLAAMPDVLNRQIDGGRDRFRLHTAFELYQTPAGVPQVRTNATGPYGLVEFTGALPRALLYDRWRSGMADAEVLGLLGATNFNPHSEVLVNEILPAPDSGGSAGGPGTVRFVDYQPAHCVVETEATGPRILLVNDRFHPHWKVRVDGKDARLLRGNYLMRAVHLGPGKHTVEFEFMPPLGSLWVSLAAIASCLGLLGYAGWISRGAAPVPQQDQPVLEPSRQARRPEPETGNRPGRRSR